MRAKEQTKRLIMFWTKVLIVLIQTGMFAWVWYIKLKDLAEIQYWRRGNWAVIALYFVMVVVFSKSFGGYKVGYLRNWDVIYTQIFAVLVTNGMAYIQLCLIGNWKLSENLSPILILTGIDIVLVVIWVVFMRWIYTNLFPPHQMLLIHGDISPDAIMHKLETREDRFHIKETVHIQSGIEAVLDKIDEHEVVLIGDIPAHERNIFLKYCKKYPLLQYPEDFGYHDYERGKY